MAKELTALSYKRQNILNNLAVQANVLDWPAQSVEAACLSQLNQWIGVAANEDQQAIRQVRSFIEQHGESRFTPKQTGYSSQVRQRAGWIDRTGPQTLYLFYPTDHSAKSACPTIPAHACTVSWMTNWTINQVPVCHLSVHLEYTLSKYKCLALVAVPHKLHR